MIPRMTLSVAEARAWRPSILGGDWSDEPMAFYHAVIPTLPRDCTIVEVGVAYGRSLLYAASLMRVHHPHGLVIGVDPWQGQTLADVTKHSPCTYREALASILAGAQGDELEITYLLRTASVGARRCFQPGMIGLVFIDGDHSYRGCADDILNWEEVVQPGGIVAGHDYTARFPGVRRAVDELCPRGFQLDGTVWSFEVGDRGPLGSS